VLKLPGERRVAGMPPRLKLLLLVVALAVAGGAWTSAHAQSAQSDGACRGPARAALALADLPVARVATDIDWRGDAAMGEHDITRVQAVTGPCTRHIAGFMVDAIYLDDGTTFRIDADKAEPSSQYAWQGPHLGGNAAHPEPEEGWVMGSRMGYLRTASGLLEIYVGLWRGVGGSEVDVFVRDSQGAHGQRMPLFRSRRALTSLRYFPAPDTPAGQLSFVLADGNMRWLVRMDWLHGGLWPAIKAAWREQPPGIGTTQ